MYLVTFMHHLIFDHERGVEFVSVSETEEKAYESIEKVKSGNSDIFIPNIDRGEFKVSWVDVYE